MVRLFRVSRFVFRLYVSCFVFRVCVVVCGVCCEFVVVVCVCVSLCVCVYMRMFVVCVFVFCVVLCVCCVVCGMSVVGGQLAEWSKAPV